MYNRVIHYTRIVEQDTFALVIVPTVLRELDELKIRSPDKEFRNKVDSIISRIKGWRHQGSLLKGVKVNKTITIRTVASEPNFEKTLHWLDASNSDDRIIASVLEIQITQPSATVVLITGDINLQNKAEMANLPFLEPPEE